MNKSVNKFCIFELSFLFLIGSLFGVFWEDTVYLFSHKFDLITHAGVIYGPFNPLYGFACLLSVILLAKKNYSIPKTFIILFFLSGIIEYLAGLILEITLSVRCWNYSNYFLNIQGKTTIPYMIIWALGLTFLIKVIYPKIHQAFLNIPNKPKKIIAFLIILFFTFDISMSCIALARQKERKMDIPVSTKIDVFCDKYYNDLFLKEIYSNMEFLNQSTK